MLRHFINGAYVEGSGSESFDLISPVTGAIYARSPNADSTDADSAYAVVRAAFRIWGRSTPSARQKALLELADAVGRNSDQLIEVQSRNTGQLKHYIASEEVAAAIDHIRFFAGAAR